MTVPADGATTASTTSTNTSGATYTPTTTTYPTGVTTTVVGVPVPAAAPPAATPAVVAQPGTQGTQGATEGDGLPDDPAVLRAEIEKLRRENGAARTTAKANAAEQARNELAQAIGTAIGLVPDDKPVDPAQLTAQLTEQTSAAKQANLELAIFRSAAGAGAEPNALLDSVSFMRTATALDVSDATAVADAIKAAVAANPALGLAPSKRTPMPNPAMGASANGAPDLEALIAEAQKRGDIATVIHLQNQKLAAPQR